MRKILIVMVMASLWLVTPIMAQDKGEQCFDGGGLFDSETETCEISIALDINVQYPIEYTDIPFVMEKLSTVLNDEVDGFMTSFYEGGRYPIWGGWALDIGYTEMRHSDTVFTVVFHEYLYTGGAHGIGFDFAFTFDTASETELTLDDIFTDVDAGLAFVAPIASAQVVEILGEDWADLDWVETGTDPTNPLNYQTWALTADTILFFFDQYQVSPYAAGAQTVEIPLSDLWAVLEPPFVPAS